jgi:hypothetical protein
MSHKVASLFTYGIRYVIHTHNHRGKGVVVVVVVSAAAAAAAAAAAVVVVVVVVNTPRPTHESKNSFHSSKPFKRRTSVTNYFKSAVLNYVIMPIFRRHNNIVITDGNM